tara:strand:+ start:695 stop:1006 length:312 start_codon:yes stop_codon:yes gene_type:complete
MRTLYVIAILCCSVLASFQQATHIEVVATDPHHFTSAGGMMEKHCQPNSGFHDCHSCAHHHSIAVIAKAVTMPVSLVKQAEIASRDRHYTSRLPYPPSRPPRA